MSKINGPVQIRGKNVINVIYLASYSSTYPFFPEHPAVCFSDVLFACRCKTRCATQTLHISVFHEEAPGHHET